MKIWEMMAVIFTFSFRAQETVFGIYQHKWLTPVWLLVSKRILTIFLAHLSTQCSSWAIVITLCPSSSVFLKNISKTTDPISFKFYRIVWLMALYQNGSNGSAPLNKMAAKLKVEKSINNTSFTSGPFQNNFTEVCLLWPSTEIAKIVLLGWTKWRPELKIEKPLNDIYSKANGPIFPNNFTKMFFLCFLLRLLYVLHPSCIICHLSKWYLLLNFWSNSSKLYRIVWLMALYQSCSNGYAPLNHEMATRAKNRKTFKQISYEASGLISK